MGYYVVIGNCAACRRVFSFNPFRVPAITIRGEREPLCQSCAERWNQLHPESARAILPGAYDAIPEAWEEPEP